LEGASGRRLGQAGFAEILIVAAFDELYGEAVWAEEPADAASTEGYGGFGVGDEAEAGGFEVGYGLFEGAGDVAEVVEASTCLGRDAYELAGGAVGGNELEVGLVAREPEELDVGGLDWVVEDGGGGLVAEAGDVGLGVGFDVVYGVADVVQAEAMHGLLLVRAGGRRSWSGGRCGWVGGLGGRRAGV
jgi:hypothetical protein